MGESQRTVLADLLADTTSEEWQLAVQVLQQTFHWCSIVTNSTSMNDRVTALDFMVRVKSALNDGCAWLDTLDVLIEQAMPGPTLQTALEERRAALAAGAHGLNELSAHVAELQQAEAALRQQVVDREHLEAQHAHLEARLAELQRLAHLAQAVEALRTQVETVERERSAAEQAVEDLEGRLAQSTQQLLTLTAPQLAHVQEQVRTLLEQADQQHTELQQTLADWQAAAARYQELEAELTAHREVLRLYHAADQAVADALGDMPDVHSAQELLQRVRRFLEQADEILARVLEARARAEEVQKLYVAGGAQ